MFHGSNPIFSWNKTDTGAFFTMILRIFAEYDKNCFTKKNLFGKNLFEKNLFGKNLFEKYIYIYTLHNH